MADRASHKVREQVWDHKAAILEVHVQVAGDGTVRLSSTGAAGVGRWPTDPSGGRRARKEGMADGRTGANWPGDDHGATAVAVWLQLEAGFTS